jgi:hypothetical protein
MMNNKLILATGAACGLLLLVVLGIFIASDEEPGTPAEEETVTTVRRMEVVSVVEPMVEPMVAPPPVVEDIAPEPEPLPLEPEVVLQEAPPLPEPVTLPGLNTSDPFVHEQISDMANADAILRHLAGSQIIRKFVVLIDGMSRGDIPSRDLPVIPPQATLTVSEQGEEFYRLDPASYTRFNLLVNTLVSIDSRQAVERFRLMVPLFETAYAELGYPGRTFTMALQGAFDNILAARVPEREILLTRPSVNYRFADPGLESLSDLEKLLIRMGPENTAKLQQKARQFRVLLAE